MRIKTIIITLLISLLFISCSEDENLKVQNVVANVYYQEDYWDMTVSALISGLQTVDSDKQQTVLLSYEIDLVSPSGEFIDDVDSGTIEERIPTGMDDLEIEVTLFIDEGFQTGEYELEFYVSDRNSFRDGSGEATFILDDDRKPNDY